MVPNYYDDYDVKKIWKLCKANPFMFLPKTEAYFGLLRWNVGVDTLKSTHKLQHIFFSKFNF